MATSPQTQSMLPEIWNQISPDLQKSTSNIFQSKIEKQDYKIDYVTQIFAVQVFL